MYISCKGGAKGKHDKNHAYILEREACLSFYVGICLMFQKNDVRDGPKKWLILGGKKKPKKKKKNINQTKLWTHLFTIYE